MNEGLDFMDGCLRRTSRDYVECQAIEVFHVKRHAEILTVCRKASISIMKGDVEAPCFT